MENASKNITEIKMAEKIRINFLYELIIIDLLAFVKEHFYRYVRSIMYTLFTICLQTKIKCKK
jgi:hypothetical protein